MVTNQNFDNGYGYFDTIFIYAGNTFLNSIVLCKLFKAAHVESCISSTVFHRIPSPKSASYCEALYTVGYGSLLYSKSSGIQENFLDNEF